MTIHFDDKGKIFTNIVSKDAVAATLHTDTHQIHGLVYVRQGDRLKDELDRAGQFLAVTDAEVSTVNGEVLFQTHFLLINRDHVIWIIPDEEVIQDQDFPGENE